MSYTEGQQALLALMPKFTGSVGITCSILLMSEIIRDYVKLNDTNPVKRALFFVTCFEISDTFGWWLSTWALPRDTDFLWAAGTWTSCNFQGFLLQIAIGVPLCNAFLTFILYTIVKGYGWDGGTATATLILIERVFYSMVIIFAFGTSFLFLGIEMYNPFNQVCVMIGNPLGCSESVFGGSDIPCERGFNAHWYGIFGFYLVVWASLGCIIYWNIAMRRALKKSNSTDAEWVTKQALLFSMAFIVSWMPSTLWFILPMFGITGFWLDILSATFEPLLGFWNLMIFLRNRPESIERIRQLFQCRLWCFHDDGDVDSEGGDDDADTNKKPQSIVAVEPEDFGKTR
jgi:hypothetical protein